MTTTSNLTRIGRRTAQSLRTDDVVAQRDPITLNRFYVRIVDRDGQRDGGRLLFYTARRVSDGLWITATFTSAERPAVYRYCPHDGDE